MLQHGWRLLGSSVSSRGSSAGASNDAYMGIRASECGEMLPGSFISNGIISKLE